MNVLGKRPTRGMGVLGGAGFRITAIRPDQAQFQWQNRIGPHTSDSSSESTDETEERPPQSITLYQLPVVLSDRQEHPQQPEELATSARTVRQTGPQPHWPVDRVRRLPLPDDGDGFCRPSWCFCGCRTQVINTAVQAATSLLDAAVQMMSLCHRLRKNKASTIQLCTQTALHALRHGCPARSCDAATFLCL